MRLRSAQARTSGPFSRMERAQQAMASVYFGATLRRPLVVLAMIALLNAVAGFHATRVELDALRSLRLQRTLTSKQRQRPAGLSQRLRQHHAQARQLLRQDIAAARAFLDRYRDAPQIHLAGVPMIVADMIRFIAHDLRVFGAGVLGFIVVLLGIAFRRPRTVFRTFGWSNRD